MPSIQTNVWGPPQWVIIHLLSLSYPGPEHRVKYARKFLSDFETLPCNLCINNVPGNLAALGVGTPDKLPTVEEFAASPYFESSDTLFYFFFQLHNQVSRMLEKPTVPLSQYHQTKAMYETALAKCGAPSGAAHSGCTVAADGYQPCMSRVVVVPRPSQNPDAFHGPAFYLDGSLKYAV